MILIAANVTLIQVMARRNMIALDMVDVAITMVDTTIIKTQAILGEITTDIDGITKIQASLGNLLDAD